MNKIKVALFGYGRAGKIHFKNLIESEYFELSCVVDLIKYQYIAPDIIFVNYKDNSSIQSVLHDSKIEAFIVASPTSTHYEIVKMGLEHDKHIFVEKPLVSSTAEISECFDLSEKKGLTLFVGYNRRFDPTLKAIKARINNGEIGKINYATTTSRDYPYPTEAYLAISSGIFHDCATHDIDYINWMLDDQPTSVYVSANDNVSNYNFDYVTINLKYSKGTLVCLNLSRIASSYDQRCEFYGEKGEIINNSFDPIIKQSFPERYETAFKEELFQFYRCVTDKSESLIKKKDCIANHIISDCCEKSYDTKMPIDIKYQ